MGSVRFRKLNAINSLPIGLAPLSLVPVAFYVYEHWNKWFVPSLGSILCLYFIIFILLHESVPSGQDLKVAFNWKSILLYSLLGVSVILVRRVQAAWLQLDSIQPGTKSPPPESDGFAALHGSFRRRPVPVALDRILDGPIDGYSA